jgi:transcriptional regulator with XRE-family HTH domain
MDFFADRLRAARLALGMTQAQLARKAGLSVSTIRDLESGKNRATTRLLQIAKALRVNPAWLETGKGQKEPVTQVDGAYLVAESLQDLAEKLLDKGPETIAELIKLIIESKR